MSGNEVTNLPSLSSWETDSLRVTCILSPSADIPKEVDWWQTLFSEPPENEIYQPKTGVRQLEGGYFGGRLYLAIQPFRIDWLLTKNNNNSEENLEIPSIGAFSERVRSFTGKMKEWMKLSPQLQRLAFGAMLYLPQESKEEAYKQIINYFPLNKIDLEDASDFSYQINRKRDSKLEIPNLKINRLSKWGIVGITQVKIIPQIQYSMSKEFLACSLELDINTAQEFQGDLPQEKLPDLLEELVELATEITVKGDIR